MITTPRLTAPPFVNADRWCGRQPINDLQEKARGIFDQSISSAASVVLLDTIKRRRAPNTFTEDITCAFESTDRLNSMVETDA